MSSNFYAKFKALFPDPPLLVGTVISFENGEATLTLPGGGKAKARGNTTVGAKVFFRDGLIQGIAPALTDVTIEI